MKKAIIAVSAAMLIVGMGPTIAQTTKQDKPTAESADTEQRGGPRFSAEDRAAFMAARIAALKAVLDLKPDQEKNWATFESAVRANMQERMEQREERRENRGERMNGLEMLSKIAANMRERADRLTKLVDAAKPLFDSLDEAQKRRFAMVMREHFGMMRERFEMMREHGSHWEQNDMQ